MQLISKNLKNTEEIAYTLAEEFKTHGGVIALSGELGAGKTTFAQFFAKALGIQNKIISPTFIIERQYKINPAQTLHHLDLYRIETAEDIKSLSIKELLQNPKDILLIEWPEKIKDLHKIPHTLIKINLKSNNSRIFEVSNYPNSP